MKDYTMLKYICTCLEYWWSKGYIPGLLILGAVIIWALN